MKAVPQRLPWPRAGLLLFVAVLAAAQVPRITMGPGRWSRHAKDISGYDPMLTTMIRVQSPASKATVVFDGHNLFITTPGPKPHTDQVKIDFRTARAEFLWAPDGQAFAITWSEDGDAGPWHAQAYLLGEKQTRKVDLLAAVVSDFTRNVPCRVARQGPNFGALDWLDGHAQLLVAAQVPPLPACANRGRVRGYVVAAPSGKIVRMVEEKELREKWGDLLGSHLQQ